MVEVPLRVAIALSPLAHGHPGALLEEPMQRDVGAKSAEVGHGADGCVRAGEEREGLFEPDMQDFLKRRMPDGLAKAPVEERARAAEAADERGDGQSVARLATDDFDSLQDERLAPPRAARGFAAQRQKRTDGDLGDASGFAAMTGGFAAITGRLWRQ